MTTIVKIGKHMQTAQVDGVWIVATLRGEDLGAIEWHAKWRQFQFVPAERTAFTHDCLAAMGEFLRERTAEKLAAGGGS